MNWLLVMTGSFKELRESRVNSTIVHALDQVVFARRTSDLDNLVLKALTKSYGHAATGSRAM